MKILIVVLLSMNVFAGSGSARGDDLKPVFDNELIKQFNVGDYAFDQKLDGYLLKTKTRELLVKNEEHLDKYEEIINEIDEELTEAEIYGGVLDRDSIIRKLDLEKINPFIIDDF